MNVKGGDGSGREDAAGDDVVVRKGERGWVVGEENVADLTSAMVLADLFAADQADSADSSGTDSGGTGTGGAQGKAGRAVPPAPRPNPSGPHVRPTDSGVPGIEGEATGGEAERLAVTVAQLEHALAARVRVEQAIGVLAERHRLRPREAFDLLRRASRTRGARVADLAHDVVASTANPLLRLPDELSRSAPEPRQRGRSLRRGRHAANS